MMVQRRSRLFPSAIALVSMVWSLSLVWAQEGTITGRVTDPPGGVIPGVRVTATNVETGIKMTIVTNGEGNYVFPFLPPGNYQLSTARSGFKPFVRSGL